MEATTKNVRIIHTNLFTDKAFEACDSVLGQLSDGWGENNPRNDRYWMYARVERQPDGEVIIKVSTISWKSGCSYSNGFYNMTDDEVKAFFAKMIKKTARMELEYGSVKNGWQRHSQFKTGFLNHHTDLTIGNVYCMYELLLGRKFDNRYTAAELEDAIGKPRSNEETEAARVHAEKKNEIESNWDKARAALAAEEKAAIEAIQAKYRLLRDAEWKKFQAAMDELKAGQIA